MNTLNILGQISGNDLIHTMIMVIVFGIIFWLLWWLIAYCGIPEPFNKVARVILALCAVLLLINCLLSLAGHPLVRW